MNAYIPLIPKVDRLNLTTPAKALLQTVLLLCDDGCADAEKVYNTFAAAVGRPAYALIEQGKRELIRLGYINHDDPAWFEIGQGFAEHMSMVAFADRAENEYRKGGVAVC